MNSNILERVKQLGPLFLFTVVIPTTLAIVYYAFIASDVYISESRFVVKNPDKPQSSSLSTLLSSSGAGVSAPGDEVASVEEYVISRDALRELNKGNFIADVYSRPGVDWIGRFPGPLGNASFEKLYKYYQKKVSVDHEASAIATMKVRAYTAQDAFRINEKLLELGERLVNKLNSRARSDLIRYAEAELKNSQNIAQSAAVALSEYRNQQGVVDPDRQSTVQLQLVSKLQDELIASKSQLAQLRSFTPENPQIPVLQTRINGLTREIDSETSKMAGGARSLAGVQVRYQRLVLESQLADKQLAGALASLEDARNEARRKQVYLERIVQPNIPDEPLEPRRMRGILSVLALGVVAWVVLSMMLAGVREHRD